MKQISLLILIATLFIELWKQREAFKILKGKVLR